MNRVPRRGDAPSEGVFASVAELRAVYRVPECSHFARLLNAHAFRFEAVRRPVRLALKGIAADVGEALR